MVDVLRSVLDKSDLFQDFKADYASMCGRCPRGVDCNVFDGCKKCPNGTKKPDCRQGNML